MSHNPIQKQQKIINAPFRVKSAAVSLAIILVIGLYYAANLFPMLPSSSPVPEGGINLLITTAAVIILLEIVLQIVLFIGAGQIEKRTASDDSIEAKSSRNAYLVLTAGVFATIASLMFQISPFEMASVLLMVFLVAEVVKFMFQIIYTNQTRLPV